MATLWRELRLAFRRLRADLGFTSVGIATLALGIGASVTIFTVVDAVMLRPLPYPEPERLVYLDPGENSNMTLADELGGAPSIAASTGIAGWELTLTGDGEAAAVNAQLVNAGFFEVFGVRPMLGRAFRPDERDPERSEVVILSYGLWQRRYGGDPSIIGRRILLDGYGHSSREVIGVMPRGFVPPFEHPGTPVQLWVPLTGRAGRSLTTDSSWYVNHVVGRLSTGATASRTAQEVRATVARLRAQYPGRIDEDAVRRAGAVALLPFMIGDVGTPLWILLAATGLTLALACANLANLLLARGERRRREFAVRTALGASRGRLVRELLSESAILAVAGGAIGVGSARVLLALLRVSESSGLPRSSVLGLDVPVLLFALGVSIACIAGFGLLPALRATGGDLRADLSTGGRSHGRTRTGRRLGAALIAGEMALAMVVATGAGLLLNSLKALHEVDPGLDPHQVLAVSVKPPDVKYRGARATQFYDELLPRLAALPGVRSTGAIHLLPFTDNNWQFPYLAQDHPPPANGPLPDANFRVVTPGYFATVGMRVVAGRGFLPDDRKGAPEVMVINQTLARELWPNESALGKEIKLFGNDAMHVVGVVGDVHQSRLDREPRPEMYVPQPQFGVAAMTVMLRTSVPPASLAAAVRREVAAVDATVPIGDVRPFEEVLEASMARRRFFAAMLTCFGLLALGLGAVGVYGVMAYAVGSRRAEFGLRMALGATASDVLRATMVGGLAPLGAGLAFGLAGVALTTRWLRAQLYGVTATDPATLITSVAVLLAVALTAILVPALRASRVTPLEALRE